MLVIQHVLFVNLTSKVLPTENNYIHYNIMISFLKYCICTRKILNWRWPKNKHLSNHVTSYTATELHQSICYIVNHL